MIVAAMAIYLLVLLLRVDPAESGTISRNANDSPKDPEDGDDNEIGEPVKRRDNEIAECLLGSVVRDVCERCAKSTGSILAYPLCCEGSVNVRNWCEQFLAYTLDESST